MATRNSSFADYRQALSLPQMSAAIHLADNSPHVPHENGCSTGTSTSPHLSCTHTHHTDNINRSPASHSSFALSFASSVSLVSSSARLQYPPREQRCRKSSFS